MGILQEIKDLDRLADDLERESITWNCDYDISQRPQYPTRAYLAREEEEKRRNLYLWDHSVALGEILFLLNRARAFNGDARTQNALYQMEAEMNRARHANSAPLYSPGRKRPACPGSQPWSKAAREMFLVKTVEGFCKIWARSYDDRRVCKGHYYLTAQEKASFRIKMLRAVSQRLKAKPASFHASS